MRIKQKLTLLILSLFMLETATKADEEEGPQGFVFPLEPLSATDYKIVGGDKDSSGESGSCGACGS